MRRSESPAELPKDPLRSTWARDYEALALSANTVPELRDLSVQYIARQREEFMAVIDQGRSELERSHVEFDRCRAEADRLRDTLRRMRTELEARSQRLARGDLEDLRGMIARGLRPPGDSPGSCWTELAGDAASNTGANAPASAVMRRLRSRMEQLERREKSLQKENDHLRLQRAMAQRESEQRSTGRSQGERPRSPGQALRSARHSPRSSSASGQAGAEDGAAGKAATADRPEAASDGQSERERKLQGERDHLLSMVQHLEKEQAEQQQYADQVVNQLGHALRALEAENGTLQEEVRQGGQRLTGALEARRKLERQLRADQAEKEALTRQVVALRSGKAPPLETGEGRAQLQSPSSFTRSTPMATEVAPSPTLGSLNSGGRHSHLHFAISSFFLSGRLSGRGGAAVQWPSVCELLLARH